MKGNAYYFAQTTADGTRLVIYDTTLLKAVETYINYLDIRFTNLSIETARTAHPDVLAVVYIDGYETEVMLEPEAPPGAPGMVEVWTGRPHPLSSRRFENLLFNLSNDTTYDVHFDEGEDLRDILRDIETDFETLSDLQLREMAIRIHNRRDLMNMIPGMIYLSTRFVLAYERVMLPVICPNNGFCVGNSPCAHCVAHRWTMDRQRQREQMLL
jgi:hypothetical protein